MRRWAFALGLWLLGWAEAQAEQPRVYVTAHASDAALDIEARQIAAFARFALAESQGFRWQDADLRVRGDDLKPAHEAQDKALSLLRRGRQAYLALELEEAIKHLEQAAILWEQAAAALDSPEPVAETLMYLGACHVLAGDLARARAAFARYHLRFPQLAPSSGVFNPEIMRHWEQAGSEQSQAPGSLDIRVRPSNAEVSVDGQVRGLGDVVVPGLAPGEHWVRVSVVGGQGFTTRAFVESGGTTRVDAGTLNDSTTLLDLFEHAASAQSAQALAQTLGLDALGVVEVRRASGHDQGDIELAMVGFDAHTGQQKVVVSQTVGADFAERAQVVRSMVAMWLDHVVRQLANPDEPWVATSAPARSRGAQEGKPAWYRRWQVWAVAGGVLAAGVVTTALLVSRDRDDGAPPAPENTGTLVLEF